MRKVADIESRLDADELAKKNNKQRKEIDKTLELIKQSKPISIDRVSQLSWVWVEVYKKAVFEVKNIDKEALAKLGKKIDEYLEDFVEDRLLVDRKNFYAFEMQKFVLMRKIEKEKMLTTYGYNFIVSDEIDNYGNPKTLPDFSLLQICFALEKMGYLGVQDFWPEKEYARKDDIRRIKINLVLNDIFIYELDSNYRKDNPSQVVECYDEDSGRITFADEEILLQKGNKKTDAARLMESLMKAEDDEWMERGEILEDWGLTKDDRQRASKNKVYYAKSKINDEVDRITGIDDFIEGSTMKFRINPRYKNPDL
ncbi:hypothetical protein HN358_01335 [Candidatus Uhrbacteria bacterium]|nr:hypothetical protein [Candidatus Uhrbacteria bacterium]MBT7717325.1 hypothetical protein [Candidatus Uhrbacteria bacterium]